MNERLFACRRCKTVYAATGAMNLPDKCNHCDNGTYNNRWHREIDVRG